ncbi:universal stress protein [Tomitella cavernea]|uniref:Universal stress protein n=1 Tax=Tomitella cavernea TaxID=1387982 RepID=A0ABP9D4I3_9ACTN|nr:universal stress protein [Tomitella cavernea]
MRTSGPVIVGTDGSDHAESAVRWAADFARLHGVPLQIVVVIPTPLGVGFTGRLLSRVVDSLDRPAQEVADSAVAQAREAAPGLEVGAEVTSGPVGKTMLEYALGAGTIVVGESGRGGVARGLLGSLSSLLVRLAACQVVVVRAMDGDLYRDARAVVVGVDGSENGATAVEAAFIEASLRRVPLVAVHSWSDVPLSVFSAADVTSWYDETSIAQAVLGERLAGFGADYPDVEVQRVVVQDSPQEVLIQWGEIAQLLVLGARGRGGVPGLQLGATAARVLRNAACPVLIGRRGDGV